MVFVKIKTIGKKRRVEICVLVINERKESTKALWNEKKRKKGIGDLCSSRSTVY